MKRFTYPQTSVPVFIVLLLAFIVMPGFHASAHCGSHGSNLAKWSHVPGDCFSQINALTQTITDAVSDIGNLAGSFATDSGNVIGDLNSVSGNLSALDGDIAGLSGDVTGLFGNLNGDLTSLDGDISSGFSDTIATISGLSGSVLGDFSSLTSDLTSLGADIDIGFSELAGDLSGEVLSSTGFIKAGFLSLTDEFLNTMDGLYGEIDGVFMEISSMSNDVAGGFQSFAGNMASGFTSLNSKLGGIGDRFGGSISRMVALGERLATVVSNPDEYAAAMASTLTLVEVLPELLTATTDFTTQLDVTTAIIDNLPEIVDTLPALVEFSNEFPILIVELQTNLIANAPQIIEGLPELLGSKVDGFFANVNEDITVLLSLIPVLEPLSDINDLSDTTNGDIATKVQEITDALNQGFQDTFTILSETQALALETTNDSDSEASQLLKLAAMEQDIQNIKAQIFALQEENRRLEQPHMLNTAEEALLWLLSSN